MSIFDSLQVIEIQCKNDHVSFGATLVAMRLLTDAFCPESCTRQVMIFFKISKEERFQEHYKVAETLAQKCTHLKGKDAYAFLLSWVVGGEYRIAKAGAKIPMFNDNHILGQFKSKWIKFIESKRSTSTNNPDAFEIMQDSVNADFLPQDDIRKNFIRVINSLLQDAHEVRRRIESKSYGKGAELRANLDMAVSNVMLSRSSGLPIRYEHMHSQHYSSYLYEFLKNETKKLSLCIAHHLVGSPVHKGIFSRLDLYSKQMKMLSSQVDRVLEEKTNENTESVNSL